jgi:hypothetical protein
MTRSPPPPAAVPPRACGWRPPEPEPYLRPVLPPLETVAIAVFTVSAVASDCVFVSKSKPRVSSPVPRLAVEGVFVWRCHRCVEAAVVTVTVFAM